MAVTAAALVRQGPGRAVAAADTRQDIQEQELLRSVPEVDQPEALARQEEGLFMSALPLSVLALHLQVLSFLLQMGIIRIQ